MAEGLEDEDYFEDWDFGDSPSDPESKTQETLAIQPSYEKQDEIKFEFTGTLLVPTAEEIARIERERPREMMTVVGSKPVIFVAETKIERTKRHGSQFQKVKMNGLDALRLRQRGV
jgi:hypothetical protein